MRRSQQNLLFLVVVFIVCSLLLFQSKHDLPAGLTASSIGLWAPPSQKPKITVIAIWSITKAQSPAYFPYFFHSVENNQDIDLLFIQVDRVGIGCPSHSTAPNVKEVCLTEDQCKHFLSS